METRLKRTAIGESRYLSVSVRGNLKRIFENNFLSFILILVWKGLDGGSQACEY